MTAERRWVPPGVAAERRRGWSVEGDAGRRWVGPMDAWVAEEEVPGAVQVRGGCKARRPVRAPQEKKRGSA